LPWALATRVIRSVVAPACARLRPLASKLAAIRPAKCHHIDAADGRVHHARNGDVRLAYRVFGEGDPTVVWVPGWVSNVDLYDDPAMPFAPTIERLAEGTRLIVWDKRGTGLSDPVTHPPPLDERMSDLRAVMDAAGAERPALFGVSEGGPMSLLFAATYPERVRALVLYGTTACTAKELASFPGGLTRESYAAALEEINEHWGEGALADRLFGAAADIPGVREMLGRYQRLSASPTMAALLWKSLLAMDVRAALRAISAPTLVLSRREDRMIPFGASQALAAEIPGAEYREMPPGPHALFDEALGSAILEFVCDQPSRTVSERLLTTVLFTDIVGSTEQLAAQGDDSWRHLLDAHDRLVDGVLAKYSGKREKHTGDGVFAMFDGPTRAARCGLELVPALATRGIRIRAGIHTGECERRGDEWSGLAIHTGARIGAMAGSGEVLASRTVRDLSVGSGLVFESLGPQHLKGLPDEVEVYRVTAP
jgi:pimeloyl-ACP methyl ester carboxylesterase